MKAMILAAGRGERLRPLTDHTPKPLILLNNRPIIVHIIERLRINGIKELVINTSYLGSKIKGYLGDGAKMGVEIQYSDEPKALETAGGIRQALPLLGDQPFLVINGDLCSDYPFNSLTLPPGKLAKLVLVENPPHNLEGDFSLKGGTVTVKESLKGSLTFAGIGIYSPVLFSGLSAGKVSLAPLLREKLNEGLILGEHYHGIWHDIGTIDRLNRAEECFINETDSSG